MTVQHVGPVYDDARFDPRDGWQFVCAACGWRSPVMNWSAGAERHQDEHAATCPKVTTEA